MIRFNKTKAISTAVFLVTAAVWTLDARAGCATYPCAIDLPAREFLRLRPSQTHAGFDAVRSMVKLVIAKATPAPGETFRDAIRRAVQEGLGNKALPGIEIAASAKNPTVTRYLITDGHHRSLAMDVIFDLCSGKARLGLPLLSGCADLQNEIDIKINVSDDWTRYSERQIAEGLFGEKKKGYVPKQMRNVSALDRYRAIPETFPDIFDYGMRSVIGTALYRAKVDNVLLVDYTEFFLAEKWDDTIFEQAARILEQRGNAIPWQGMTTDSRDAWLVAALEGTDGSQWSELFVDSTHRVLFESRVGESGAALRDLLGYVKSSEVVEGFADELKRAAEQYFTQAPTRLYPRERAIFSRIALEAVDDFKCRQFLTPAFSQ